MADKNLRIFPQDINAEAAVLSAMMIDEYHLSHVVDILKKEHFYKPAHQIIFGNMLELYKEKTAIDIITLIDILNKNNVLEKVGGKQYLHELSDVVYSGANITYHAKIVQDKYVLRTLIGVSNQIIEKCYNQDSATDTIVDESEKLIFEATEKRITKSFEWIGNLMDSTLSEIEEIAGNKGGVIGVRSGFHDLDYITGGFKKGQLIILAARPSMGKTSFAINIAINAALSNNKKIAIFSMEMGYDELIMRMLAAPSEVSSDHMTKGFGINDEKIKKITEVAIALEKKNIYIDDSGMNTMFSLISKTRRLAAELDGVDLIIIDYLQLMSSTRNRENRQQEISEISRSLKVMSKEFEVPIIAISQLSRGVESRDNKRPMLSDLRESGAIEQDADLVLFIYRDAYYHPDTAEDPRLTELIIGKNRHGPQGTIKLNFDHAITRFSSRDTVHEPTF